MTKPYSVALVGERSYQDAIAGCGEGEAVVLVREPDNPYDERAIAAVCHGDTIGYIGRDCWLHDVVHDEGKGCSASIRRIARAGKGISGVVLEVRLCDEPLGERPFDRLRASGE